MLVCVEAANDGGATGAAGTAADEKRICGAIAHSAPSFVGIGRTRHDGSLDGVCYNMSLKLKKKETR